MSGLNICKSARITQSAPGCDDGGQGEGGSDVAGELVVIGGDAAEILEAAEHRLEVARAAQRLALENSPYHAVLKSAFPDVPPGNAAVQAQIPFDPNARDGRCTKGLAFNKSNWANTIEKPPFEAYSVGCGITFTFGGLKIDTTSHVLDAEDMPIPGLYAAGELVGGIFYHNYPGGTGLTSGTVFGKLAGTSAAQDLKK